MPYIECRRANGYLALNNKKGGTLLWQEDMADLAMVVQAVVSFALSLSLFYWYVSVVLVMMIAVTLALANLCICKEIKNTRKIRVFFFKFINFYFVQGLVVL